MVSNSTLTCVAHPLQDRQDSDTRREDGAHIADLVQPVQHHILDLPGEISFAAVRIRLGPQ